MILLQVGGEETVFSFDTLQLFRHGLYVSCEVDTMVFYIRRVFLLLAS